MNDNEYQAKVDADFDMDVWKCEKRAEYLQLLLSGHTIIIGNMQYAFEDMLPERYSCLEECRQFNHCLIMIMKGASDSDKFLKEFLEPQLDKVIEEIIDAKIEEMEIST